MPSFGRNYVSLMKNRPLVLVSWAQLIRIFGRSQTWIFLPVYLFNYRGVQYDVIGLLFTLTALFSIPVSVYGGNLCDKLGRRKVALMTMPFGILIFFMVFLSAYLNLPTIIFFIALISSEPLFSIQWIVDNAIITDSVSEVQRTDAFSITRIAGNLGFSIGPAVGGFLSDFSLSYVFLSTLLMSFVELVIYVMITETNKNMVKERSSIAFPRSDKKFLAIALLMASIWFVAGQWGTTLTLFWTSFDRIPNVTIGILYSLNGLFVVLLQLPTNRMMINIPDHVRMFIGGMIYAVSFFALSLFSGFAFLVIDVFFLTLGENTISPVTSSVVSKIAPDDRRGQYFGAFYLVSGFVTPMAPLMGTSLMQYFSYSPIIFWGIIAAIGTTISFFMLLIGGRIISQRTSSPGGVQILDK